MNYLTKCLLMAFILFTTANNVYAGAAGDYSKGITAAISGNYEKAVVYLRKAAEQGHAGAQNLLGLRTLAEKAFQKTIQRHMRGF
jgi:TPR repeat protein